VAALVTVGKSLQCGMVRHSPALHGTSGFHWQPRQRCSSLQRGRRWQLVLRGGNSCCAWQLVSRVATRVAPWQLVSRGATRSRVQRWRRIPQNGCPSASAASAPGLAKRAAFILARFLGAAHRPRRPAPPLANHLIKSAWSKCCAKVPYKDTGIADRARVRDSSAGRSASVSLSDTIDYGPKLDCNRLASR